MPEAEQDMMDIWFYGYWNFGVNQADQYARKLSQQFLQLVLNELGRKRTDLGNHVYAMPYRKHVIYYQADSVKVCIVRVLHHSQDALSQITRQKWL